VLPFVLADLVVLPILDIHRRYYGWRMEPHDRAERRVHRAGSGALARHFAHGGGVAMLKGLNRPTTCRRGATAS
jgi:hypothetical protein